jgi:hypothetical protein
VMKDAVMMLMVLVTFLVVAVMVLMIMVMDWWCWCSLRWCCWSESVIIVTVMMMSRWCCWWCTDECVVTMIEFAVQSVKVWTQLR